MSELPDRLVPLIKAGIVGREQCPEQHFWRWPVLKPERLPADLAAIYMLYGEIRWYKSGSE